MRKLINCKRLSPLCKLDMGKQSKISLTGSEMMLTAEATMRIVPNGCRATDKRLTRASQIKNDCFSLTPRFLLEGTRVKTTIWTLMEKKQENFPRLLR